MASSVYYKFKSQKTESRVTFDGTGISVFDLKKEIILANNFGKATDFDLLLLDSSEKEFKNDSEIIPRSTSVIAKRMPPARPGKGKAAIYIAGVQSAGPSSDRADSKSSTVTGSAWSRAPGGAMSKRFDGKDDKPRATHPPPPTATSESSVTAASVADDEAARIKAMFQANAEHWEETQERMSHATPIHNAPRHTGPKKAFHQPQQPVYESKPLPPGYICHRCSKKGHWIQDCPTNDDREFDHRPRIKRTTGIPRSFLKAVDVSAEGTPQGVMITPDGGFVVAQPDSASWQKQRARPKGLTPAEVRDKPPTDSGLACPLCTKLFRDAVKTPCCSRTYCEECIQTHLLERDFSCPGCQSKIASLDKLVPDHTQRSLVQKYIDSEIAKSSQTSSTPDRNTPEPAAQLTTADDSTSNPASTSANQQEPEYTFDSQPGNPAIQAAPFMLEIAQLQNQINQGMLMLQNPQLPPPMRMQIQMQLEEFTMRMNQFQMMSLYNGGAVNNSGMMGGGMGQGYGHMSNGMNSGMSAPMPFGGNKSNVGMSNGGGYNAMFSNQQPADSDSAYQRLPVNNRRRVQKRDRPTDFGEMDNAKIPRYWE